MANVAGYSRLLAAVMEAMCHPTIKLTSIMPINCQPATEEILRRTSVVMDDNTNSFARQGDVHKFPILVGHMTARVEVSYCVRTSENLDYNTNSFARQGDVHKFRILVGHMTARVEVRDCSGVFQ